MLEKWKKLSSEEKFKNPWWTYRLDKFRLPNGQEGEYHFMDITGSSIVVPVFNNGEILMVEQFRYLFDRNFIELPAGGRNKGEDFEVVAHKELIEETGHDGDLEFIGNFNPLNGLTTELTHVFIARNLRPSNEFSPDETEDFILHRLTPEELDRRIVANEVQDGMTLCAWALARSHFLG